MSRALTSLRHAARRLARSPALATAAVLTLMLGIGATTAVFTLVNGVLLRPLPYYRPEQLVDLSHTLVVSGVTHVDQSDATYLYYRRANHVFTDVGAYRATAVSVGAASGAGGGDASRAERVAASLASASLFGVLRVPPLHGRSLIQRDEDPGAPPVVVIGERLWERKYGGDLSIIGHRISVDGVPREVVGIMGAGFRFPASATDVWLPLGLDPANTRSAAFDYRGVARLRGGVTLLAATADLDRMLPHVPEVFPGRLTVGALEQTHMRSVVRPLHGAVVGDIGGVLWIVLGAVGFVLLVACANVANLFLVRADARRHEMAVRRALGASGAALAGDMASEGLVVAGLGGMLGVALAAVGVGVLRTVGAGMGIPRLDETSVNVTALLVALGLTALAALLVSLVPAARAASASVATALADAGRAATTGRRGGRARDTLVVAQVALALVLLVGSGLMARSFQRLRDVSPGFDAAGAVTFRVALADAAYPAPGDAARFIVRLLDAAGAIPGVQAAGAISKLPLDEAARRDTALFVEDHPLRPGSMPNVHQVAYASPAYFVAARIPLTEGRTFDRPDPARAPLEMIVSRALAARYWSGGHAIGKRVRMAPFGPWFTIIGVAGDVRGTGLDQPPDETIYLPLVTAPGNAVRGLQGDARFTPHDIGFVVRGATATAQLTASVERAVRALDPAVPVYATRSMTEVLEGATSRTRFTFLLLGLASAAALALGAVGIYGVVSYAVSLRTREIAVRLAIGARPADVSRMVSGQAAALAALGVVVGLAGAAALTRFMAALLFGVSPTDPATLAGAAVSLFIVAVGASWLPARRASRVDPARALHAD